MLVDAELALNVSDLLLEHELVHHFLIHACAHHGCASYAWLVVPCEVVLLDHVLPARRLVRQRQVRASVERLGIRLILMQRTARPLYPLRLLLRVGACVAISARPIVRSMVIHGLLVSQHRLL